MEKLAVNQAAWSVSWAQRVAYMLMALLRMKKTSVVNQAAWAVMVLVKTPLPRIIGALVCNLLLMMDAAVFRKVMVAAMMMPLVARSTPTEHRRCD